MCICAALAGEVVPGPSTSAPHQVYLEGGAGSAPPLLAEISLGGFPLEQKNDETLTHAFDQVRETPQMERLVKWFNQMLKKKVRSFMMQEIGINGLSLLFAV